MKINISEKGDKLVDLKTMQISATIESQRLRVAQTLYGRVHVAGVAQIVQTGHALCRG